MFFLVSRQLLALANSYTGYVAGNCTFKEHISVHSFVMPKAPSYSPSKVDRAIRDIQNNVGSLRSIAKQYGIPRATLQFKIKNPGSKTTFEPSPILTEVEEDTIVMWVTELAQKGFPRKREDIVSSVQQFLNDHPRPSDDISEPQKQDNTSLIVDQPTLEESPVASNKTPLIPTETSTVTIIERSSNVTNYLMWPESPKRKGKRQTERLPFAITSRMFQEMLEKKNSAKANAEKERERKKKEREEAKEEKMKKQMLIKKRKIQCFICNRQKSDLTCDSCKKDYHSKCIPKSHQQHIPQLEDGDHFMCHKCYKEDKSDESAGEFNLEDNENEFIMQENNSVDNEEHSILQEGSSAEQEDDFCMNGDEDTLPEDKEDGVDTLYQFYLNNEDN